jgi:hypothetical protein
MTRKQKQPRAPGFYVPMLGRVARIHALCEWVVSQRGWQGKSADYIGQRMWRDYDFRPLPFGLTLFRRRPVVVLATWEDD